MERQRYILINDRVRKNAASALMQAPNGFTVSIAPATRSVDQNAKFHAICTDLGNSNYPWFGKLRDADAWKVLLVSAHTKATGGDVDIIPGLEGEFVNVRESTSRMSVARASSLIEYALAFCATHGIELTETIRGGFHDPSSDRRAA